MYTIKYINSYINMDSFFGHFLELPRSSNYNLTANFNQFNTTVLDKYTVVFLFPHHLNAGMQAGRGPSVFGPFLACHTVIYSAILARKISGVQSGHTWHHNCYQHTSILAYCNWHNTGTSIKNKSM
jgi:hypothetical protein